MSLVRNRLVQLAALVLLLARLGIYALKVKYGVTDFDTWWHLKVGDWIVQNGRLPYTGILSRTAAQRPWVGGTKSCCRWRIPPSDCLVSARSARR
jgi:hypothetical protein